ncbi:MAG TPA: carbon starvation CstA family protein [Gemmataceae bacterium]|nr:carbon starvation CstA family protein [Gemmataceae bacterium]
MPLANVFYETAANGRVLLHAMPLLLGALCCLAIAYRYYSAFLAAKVAALDDRRVTPAHRFNDGQNYHPTNKWVLFGHHFAAISGAGPLIGPVLAIQYGYLPGLLWLVIGVCLAGAVQDMLVLAASVRRDGKSLAAIARSELGPWANGVVSAAILFIVVIALAGLGFVVVKALGGEEVTLSEGTQVTLPKGAALEKSAERSTATHAVYKFPGNCTIRYSAGEQPSTRSEPFAVRAPVDAPLAADADGVVRVPAKASQLVPGSSWGTFTIAATIPIALFTGWYMYRFRKGRVVEASLIGATLTVGAVIAGNWVPGSPVEGWFSLTKNQTVLALTAYGFVASVLPVWLLLAPRDYLSSFLKIGTIGLLVVGTFLANPVLSCPPINEVFRAGGPTFPGHIFPFVFICVMCGSISGFHSLVSSGTTPKMIDKESQVRPIGYGAMLMEGLVGIVALIAAASLPQDIYYDINVPLSDTAKWQGPLDKLYQELGTVDGVEHLSLAKIEENVGGEALRGRTGGAVTLAVGMSHILTTPLHRLGLPFEGVMKYWYHFAIMFEALFILTTIDAGTRIARFLLQEALGKVHPNFERTDWLPGAALATFLVTLGWGALVQTGSIMTIWPMFGIANQLLAVIALALVTTLLVNTGRGRYAPVTLLPMLFVTATTMTAGVELCSRTFPAMIQGDKKWTGVLNLTMTIFVMTCVGALLLMAVGRWLAVARGLIPVRPEAPVDGEYAKGLDAISAKEDRVP